ncbi:hypothetical protein [Pontibacillus marinus]|uniref:Uncharacterized protein n=1 Tax=Pontibacillus marinus BH030004 = DSM 16465 TaxID=1385511 RepID=A0A0A5HVF8_9BACI|nr:hypothetical protein [Pontibacillus marinus]KGX87622.1 hypothetical protein N783_09400 [Pontibacillus marinus BH030004 = DSM 16465]
MSKPHKEDKNKIDADDGWNRALYGSPTKGGCFVFILIIMLIYWLMK